MSTGAEGAAEEHQCALWHAWQVCTPEPQGRVHSLWSFRWELLHVFTQSILGIRSRVCAQQQQTSRSKALSAWA